MRARSIRGVGLFCRPVVSATLAPLLVLAVIASTMPPPVFAQQPENPPFRIVVIEGEGSINNIKQQANRGALVLVEDENKNPLSGVSVSFFLPAEGPSGLFPNGSRVMTSFTDEKGLAASRSIRFNNLVGLMRVEVSASLFSQTAKALITQTNVSNAAAMKSSVVPAAGSPKVSKGGPSKKLIWTLIAVGAAGGAAAYFLTRDSGPKATISIGNPSIGGPK